MTRSRTGVAKRTDAGCGEEVAGMTAMLHANRNVLLTEVGDGQAVLLHLDTKFYYTLNATGIVVWKMLEAANATRDDIARELSKRFRVDESAAARDLEPVLAELLAEGLVAKSA
jgi:hypothetical protein